MFDNRLKPLNLSASGSPSLGLGEVSPSSSRAGGGKVIHDSRGNAVWQWGVATGVFAAIKSTELLNMLDNPTLALEGQITGDEEWAGDPYNRR
jgi:hypothetical protein